MLYRIYKFDTVVIVSSVLFLGLNPDMLIMCNEMSDVWRDAGRMTGLLLQNCLQSQPQEQQYRQQQFPLVLIECIKRRSLLVLDRSLHDDVIRLTNGIELIRYRDENDTTAAQQSRSFSMMESKLNETDWKTQVLQRLANLFSTHVLKIRLNGHEGPTPTESRGRRKRQSMMLSLIMFGAMAVGLVVIPMGFQFLAVLGGKALLLAKMALLLTSIQGLKKIATSNLNYGLYSTHQDRDHHHIGGHWHYDRQWPFEAHENHELNRPYNYYDAPDQQTDLLHPFQPRRDALKNIM